MNKNIKPSDLDKILLSARTRKSKEMFGANDSELIRTYSNGTKNYHSEQGYKLPEKEKNSFYIRMDKWIIAEASRQLGISKYDIDFDVDTGLLTVWLDVSDNDYELKKMGVDHHKNFYYVEAIAHQVFIKKSSEPVFTDEDMILIEQGGKF